MKQFIAPVALSAALTLTACGGGSSSHASSAAKAASPSNKSALGSHSTSSSAAPTSTAPFIDDVKLADFAEKVGCGKVTYLSGSSVGAEAAAHGIASIIKCTVGSNAFMLVRSTGAGQAVAYFNDMFGKDPKNHGAPYLAGPNWAVVEAPQSEANPTRAMVESVQKKIGGDIVTVP